MRGMPGEVWNALRTQMEAPGLARSRGRFSGAGGLTRRARRCPKPSWVACSGPPGQWGARAGSVNWRENPP